MNRRVGRENASPKGTTQREETTHLKNWNKFGMMSRKCIMGKKL